MKHDLALLVLGEVRTGLWIIGAALAWRERRLLATVVFSVAAVNASLAALVAARYLGSQWAHPSSLLGTSVVAGIVAAFLLGTRRYQRSSRWTIT